MTREASASRSEPAGWRLEQITIVCSRPSFPRKRESRLPTLAPSGCRITSGMTGTEHMAKIYRKTL